MQTHVIISYDGTENDTDALALGKMFGDAGARVSLAYVRHAEEPDAAAEQAAQAQAEELLERGASWLGHPEVGRHVILSGSTGDGLRVLAERENADLVVFGSDWHTAPGHVQPGQSALRLMEGGPVSIAIAAAGLRERSARRCGRSPSPAARSTMRPARPPSASRRAPARRWRCPRRTASICSSSAPARARRPARSASPRPTSTSSRPRPQAF